MNNVDCSRIPGHWTQHTQTHTRIHTPPCFMFRPSLIHSSFFLWLYASSRSSSSPLSLCLQLLFVLCVIIIHFNFSFYLRPLFLPASLCPSLSLTRFFPTLLRRSSVKALRNYSQWFFPCLGFSWVLGWFVRSTKVSRSGCCREYISPITSHIHVGKLPACMACREHTATWALNFEKLLPVKTISVVCLLLLWLVFFYL